MRLEALFTGLTGLWLGVCLLKFGQPVILADRAVAPRELWEWLLFPWPVAWGYATVGLVVLAASGLWRWRSLGPRWVMWLPAVWLGWQLVSATQTVAPRLSALTVSHFACCVACYYVGLFALSQVRNMRWVWLGWGAGFVGVLLVGFDQHFGGLEETRRWFFAYEYPKLAEPPSAEFLKKLQSDRIYSTLFYPNTLAGAILLTLPMLLGALGQWKGLNRYLRGGLALGLAGASLACLWWSGSKAGWLIVLIMAAVALLRAPVRPSLKAGLLTAGLLVGLVVFALKYRGYFSGGASSAAARLDYWKAALQVIRARPLLGSGPGTFGVMYRQLKPPEAEMARLAHNDYLQQGSDAGLIGLVAFCAWVGGSQMLLYRKTRLAPGLFPVWLGLLGLSLQELVEFSVFIPALAWPQFLFLGWLWGRTSLAQSDAQEADGRLALK